MSHPDPDGEGQDDLALDRLVRGLAAAHGMPHDDPEFSEVIAVFRGLWAAVDAIDQMPVDPSREPASRYDPRYDPRA